MHALVVDINIANCFIKISVNIVRVLCCVEMAGQSAGDDYDYLFKVVLIGDTGVGKSKLTSRFTRNVFDHEAESTFGGNSATRHVYVDGKVIKTLVFDDQEGFSLDAYCRDAVGALVVYDVARPATFRNLERWLKELRDFADPDMVVMLVGNKSDLSHPMTVSVDDGKTFADGKSLGFVETSAKDARNVEKAFAELITQIYRKLIKKASNGADDASASVSPSEGEIKMWDTSCVSRSSAKNEPAHYMLKIDSFSLLSQSGNVKHEFGVFEAGGHKWRLELYPNGNDEEENGGNHISLYLVICDTQKLPKGWDVHVYIRLFVYDHIRHNYLIIQVGDGERTMFDEKKTKWGFNNLISLDSFKDPENGYLFKDSCVFGAEVFAVPKYAQKDECLSMIKPPSTINSHTWRIEKFSALTQESLYSKDFKVGKVKWKLLVYPKGDKHLSIYLCLHEAALPRNESKVVANYKLRVKNQAGGACVDKGENNTINLGMVGRWFCKSPFDSWGYSCFMLLSELNDSTKGFLVNDTLIVEAEVSIVGILKDSI